MSPVSWRPVTTRLEQLIADEEAAIETLREKRGWQPTPTAVAEPEPFAIPVVEQPQWQPPSFRAEIPEITRRWQPPTPEISAPISPMVPTIIPKKVEVKEERITIPLWQRALQVFSAPFQWVDENIIQPGWALLGTTVGFVPEVERKPGEDFWEWKRRSWAGWETPGIDINVPWSDDPWRIDVKGVMEFAPWLLIPGAGQVGGGARAGMGIAGMLGKLGRVGRIAGKVVEYSPWGLAEKTAGVAIKGGIRAVGSVSERVSTAVGEKLFGKYVPPPVSPEVAKLTRYMKEVVVPAREAFEKVLPKELRARQEAAVRLAQKEYLAGKITLEELQVAESTALKEVGALRPRFAITKEALKARQAEQIAEIENRIANGELTEAGGKALITKIKESPAYTVLEVLTSEQAGARYFAIENERNILRSLGYSEEALTKMTGKERRNLFESHIAKVNEDITATEKWLDESDILLRKTAQRFRLAAFQASTDIERNRIIAEWARASAASARTPEELLLADKLLKVADKLETNLAVSRAFMEVSAKKITPKGTRPPLPRLKLPPEVGAELTLTMAEVDKLNRKILEASESGLLGMESKNALTRLLLGVADNLPEPRFLEEEWPNVFGLEFAKAVKRFRTPQQANDFMDALQIGKSLVSSADLSATFRQGLFMVLLHPTLVPKWFGRQVKAMLSEKLTFDMDDALRAKPAFIKWRNRGAYFAPQRGITPRAAEEAFPSRIAERIPGVKRSQRAFNTFLNEARLDTLELAEAAMTAQGATEIELKLFGEFVNLASGRGTLPKALNKYAPALNAVFFSPRLQMATLQLPRQLGRMLLSNNPYMRKEAAKALITFVGGGAGLLGLLNLSGVSKIELDPRSGDFAKIKIGETRLDIWRGYVQYARFAAQLLSAERKSAYGNMNKTERGEIAGRFLASKMSPSAGFFVDLWRGETYMGKPIFSDTTGFSQLVKEKLLPLALQDVIDAMEQSGINGAWVAAPAALGIGALTYVNDFVRVKERIAKEMGYKSWDDIDPKTQREIQNRNAELQAATIAFDRQVMGTAWGDWRLAGNAIEDVFRQNVEYAVNEYRQTKNGVQFNDKITEAFTARRGGYDAREKEGRFEDIVKRLGVQDTLEALTSLGPEQLAIKVYNDALFGDDMYDEFNNYRFDEAIIRKQQLRQALGVELFNYVEDYQGLKFETFPLEFQELMKAREAMRPYWQIRDKVIKQFGQRFAESSRGKALITKLRKSLRLRTPELNRYYQLFYVQP